MTRNRLPATGVEAPETQTSDLLGAGMNPTSQRSAARLLVGATGLALMVAAFVGLAAPPAFACYCVGLSAHEARAAADVVFTGQILDRTVDSDSAIYTAVVDQVYKGEVGAKQELVTSAGGGSCGLALRVGDRALIFASEDPPMIGGPLAPGQLSANLCNGTKAGGEAPAAWGAGSSPAGTSDPPPSQDATPSGIAVATTAAIATDDDSRRSTLFIVVFGLAIGAATGLWWVARRRRQANEALSGRDSQVES